MPDSGCWFKMDRVGACALTAALAFAIPVWAQDAQQKFAELGQCKLENGQIIEECRRRQRRAYAYMALWE
jgi:hypothetical protein